MMESEKVSPAARLLRTTESVVLFLIAAVLAVLAIALLASTVLVLFEAVMSGHIRDQAIDILDSILLVMMTMEIVYTVTMSLESHKLNAEPFLIVGAIAAIRRMLVITAESTKVEAIAPEVFRNALLELGLLALTIILIALSIYILRRSAQYVPHKDGA
jgi:hypothetical protein